MSSSAFVVDGITPSAVSTPMNVSDLAAVMKRAAADGRSIGVQGAGTKQGWGGTPESLDLMVSTASMNRVMEHAAGDLVVTAQAGVPLAALQRHVTPAGQWLALDPPEPGATVGGVVASAASGPRRLLYGTPRDLLIGITVVLADGTIAKSGGKVVKNVAGYDLGKLFTGSFGSLGVIAECTFRLHPLPAARRVVSAEVTDPAAAAKRVLAWVIQADDVVQAVGGTVSDQVPAGFGLRPTLPVLLKVTYRLGALRQVLDAVGSRLPGASLTAHAGSGVMWVGADDLAVLDSLRTAIAEYDGSVVVARAPLEQKATADMWGPVRGLDVMRRIKDQFDPDGRMSPGRFVGGI